MTRFARLFQWTGGALFVLSLAACAYVYVIVWASPPATVPDPWRAVAINVAAFSAFALHHSLFARDAIKRRVSRMVPDRLLRSFYVWTASSLLLLVLAVWQPLPGEIYAVTGWRALAHAAVQVGGVWLIARSVARIDPLELAGIRPEHQSPSAEALQTAGPYRWVRHPLYLGWALVVFGAARMTADRFAFAAVTTAYLVVAIPWEERSLRRFFGEQYARYQRTVRWRMIPYVY
jgi:protein-S-isoprenylcysteine O-methyltransferase Ste14